MLKSDDADRLKNIADELQAILYDVGSITHRYKRKCRFLGTAYICLETAITAIENEVQDADSE